MRTLNIPLDDAQYKRLSHSKIKYESKIKKRCSWNRFLVILVNFLEENDE